MKSKDSVVVNAYGDEIRFNAAVSLMDDELREEVHTRLAPCSPQDFFDAYCVQYEKASGEPWFLNTPNPQY